MSQDVLDKRYQIQIHLDHAHRALDSAAVSIENNFYATAINWAY